MKKIFLLLFPFSLMCQEPAKKKQKVEHNCQSLLQLAGHIVFQHIDQRFVSKLPVECHTIVNKLFLQKNHKDIFPVPFKSTGIAAKSLFDIKAIAITPDNKTLICAHDGFTIENGQIAFIDLKTQKITKKQLQYGRFLESLCITELGDVLYGTSFGVIGRCPTESLSEKLLWHHELYPDIPIHIHTITDINYPNGVLFGASDGAVKIINVNEGSIVATFDSSYAGRSLCVSKDKKILAVGCAQDIKIWDIENHKNLFSITSNQPSNLGLFSLALCFEKQLVAAGYGNGTIRLWDLRQKEQPVMEITQVATPQVRTTHIFHNNPYILGHDGYQFKLWDIRTKKQLVTACTGLATVAITKDENYVLSVGEKRLCWDLKKVYNLQNGDIPLNKIITLRNVLAKNAKLTDQQKQSLLE